MTELSLNVSAQASRFAQAVVATMPQPVARLCAISAIPGVRVRLEPVALVAEAGVVPFLV